MLCEVEGFILSETNYGETSKIINVLTREYGVIGIMCKGAKSMRSANRVSTGAYNFCHFNIYYKEDKLSVLVSADIINSFSNIKNDLILIGYIAYLSDLTAQVVKERYNEVVYDDFMNTVFKIEEKKDPLILTNILELKYLPLLGVELDLDECIKCGNKKNIVTIDASVGGLICKDCYLNEVIVDKKIIQLIRMYYYVDIKSISNINVDIEYKKTINKFISDYYDAFTGMYLKSKKFLEKLL